MNATNTKPELVQYHVRSPWGGDMAMSDAIATHDPRASDWALVQECRARGLEIYTIDCLPVALIH